LDSLLKGLELEVVTLHIVVVQVKGQLRYVVGGAVANVVQAEVSLRIWQGL